MTEGSKGVVGVIFDAEGNHWVNAADFDLDRPAGFSLEEAQKARVRRRLADLLVKAACAPKVAAAMRDYDCERLTDRLVHDHGWKREFISIGHGDQ